MRSSLDFVRLARETRCVVEEQNDISILAIAASNFVILRVQRMKAEHFRMVMMKRTSLSLSGNLHHAWHNCFAEKLWNVQLAVIYILPRQFNDV